MRKVIMMMLIILMCLIFVGCNKKEINNKSNDNQKEEKIEFVEKTKYIDDLEANLIEVGNTIYETGKFKEYSQKKGAYFISLKELRDNFNIDISIYKGEDNTKCDENISGLYFSLSESNEKNIFAQLIGCSKEEAEQINEENTSE